MNGARKSRNPTARVDSYESPAFNLLRLELEGVQQLAAQLKTKGRVGAAGELLYQLQRQVCGEI